MEITHEISYGPLSVPTPEHIAKLERLGDEIAELSAHLTRRHHTPPRPHPRVRRPPRLEHRVPLLRRVAHLAHRPRPRRGPREGPRGARPRHPAPSGGR